MSVYNGEKHLRTAVDSILGQSFKDFEFIIIDDGSADKSLDILREFQQKDKRIKIVSRENKGLTVSLNEGINLAQGEYIARMDADDISLPKRFEEQINFLGNNKDVVLCGTWAKIIDENGVELGDYKTPTTNEEIKKNIIFHNPFIHPSVIFKKEIIKTVGLYSEKIKYAQDYEYWLRIVKRNKVANLSDFLLKYRIMKKSMTRESNLRMRLEGLLMRIAYLFK